MANAAELTEAGIAAAQAGDTARAADLLRQATEADPRIEVAWLWRSSVATSDDEKRAYLQQALAANPNSASAKLGLALLGEATLAPAPQSSTADERALLAREISRRIAQDWHLVAQTETTAQLRKPKQLSAAGLVLLVIAPALGGCFWAPLFGVALIGLVVVVASYLAAQDEVVFLDVARLRAGSHLEIQLPPARPTKDSR
jgi:hypothetical protein